MTQKQKELLLKDLCARLPYGVVIQEKCVEYDETFLPNEGVDRLVNIDVCDGTLMTNGGSFYHVDEVKPYLFPFSSMTEEQKNELSKYLDANVFVKNEISFWSLFAANMMDKWKMVFEWCNKNHFDVYGLIPMDLAKDATGLNIY